jgi:hypothetical protein
MIKGAGSGGGVTLGLEVLPQCNFGSWIGTTRVKMGPPHPQGVMDGSVFFVVRAGVVVPPSSVVDDDLVLELLDSSPGSSWVALVAVLVEVLVELLVLMGAGLGSFFAGPVVRAAVLVDGVRTLGSVPVGTSAEVSLVMPGRLMTAYVIQRLLMPEKDCRCW